MATFVTPKKNTAFTFYISLTSQANPLIFQANPTLATGDAKVSIDGAALGDLTVLPDVDPNSSKLVKVALSSDEMNGDNIQVILSDAAGAEWCDTMINIQTTARQIDDLAFPTVTGRSLDVTATGAAGIDWGNIENPTTTVVFSGSTIATLTQLTATLADSIPADGTRPSVASGILMLCRFLCERAVVGTTMTVKKEDGSTSSMTFTLNDASNPTSITRAT